MDCLETLTGHEDLTNAVGVAVGVIEGGILIRDRLLKSSSKSKVSAAGVGPGRVDIVGSGLGSIPNTFN